MAFALSSGHLERFLAAQTVRGDAAMRIGLTTLANRIEAAAKENSRNGAHARGTPTPASPGSGPAVITGDLNRAITHTPVEKVSGVLQTRVGVADTPHSYEVKSQRISAHRRGGGRGSTSGVIGRALENGLRGGRRYPFLLPAFHSEVQSASETMGAAWRASEVHL